MKTFADISGHHLIYYNVDIYFQHKLNCSMSLLQLNHILHFLKKYIKIDEKKV